MVTSFLSPKPFLQPDRKVARRSGFCNTLDLGIVPVAATVLLGRAPHWA